MSSYTFELSLDQEEIIVCLQSYARDYDNAPSIAYIVHETGIKRPQPVITELVEMGYIVLEGGLPVLTEAGDFL